LTGDGRRQDKVVAAMVKMVVVVDLMKENGSERESDENLLLFCIQYLFMKYPFIGIFLFGILSVGMLLLRPTSFKSGRHCINALVEPNSVRDNSSMVHFRPIMMELRLVTISHTVSILI
jgi:hypothetical protein